MEQTMDYYFKKVLQNNKDMNVRQFPSISYLDLKYLFETIEGKVDLDPDVRKETERIGDGCLLTFFEYGLSTPVETFNDGKNNEALEYKYSVNELLFFLTNDIMMLCERDADSHRPILVTIEPSDMTNQEKKNVQTDELEEAEGSYTGRNFRRQTKLKERPVLLLQVYFSSEKITSWARAEYCALSAEEWSMTMYLPSGKMIVFWFLEWWLIVYLPPGKMIVVLNSFPSLAPWLCTPDEMIWPYTFY